MYRFLASRRWLVRTLAGLLLVAVCVRLGLWQLDRNEVRAAHNELVQTNTQASPVPLDDVADPEDPFDPADEWRQITVGGRFDEEHQLLLRLRPLDSQRGVHVLTPLVTDSGAAFLVDRGFYPSAEDVPAVPAPPGGEVELVARLRVSETTDGAGGDLSAGHIRAVDVADLATALPYPLYPAWGEAISPVDDGLVAIPPPELDAGPHLSYAVQWFIFAVIGVTGFVLLIRAEAKGQRELAATGDGAGGEPGVPDDDAADGGAGPPSGTAILHVAETGRNGNGGTER